MNSQILSKQNLLNSFIIVLMLAVASIYTLQITIAKRSFLYTDYGKFHQSLRFVLQGKSAYTPIYYVEKLKPHEHKKPTLKRLGPNLNPPFFALFFLPFALLSYTVSFWAWCGFSILCGLASLFLLMKALSLERISLTSKLCASLAFFVYFPTFTNVVLGQVGLALLPLVFGAWFSARVNKMALCGFLLGFAISLKVFLGLFILYFLIRREWRAFWICSLTIFILNSITLFSLGKKIFLDYYYIFHFISWYSSSWNASFLGFFARLFGVGELNIPLIPIAGLANILYKLCSFLLLATLSYVLFDKNHIKTTDKVDLDFSLILISILLISPLGWIYYFPFLFIPFVFLFRLAREGYYPIGLRIAACFTLILSSLPFYLKPPADISNYITVLNWAGCYFYALILLLVILLFLYKKLGALQPTQDYCDRSLKIILYLIAFAPSALGILGDTRGLVLYTTTYAPQIDKVYFGKDPVVHIYF